MMKKAHIINLIKYYSEKNDSGFKTEAYMIAEEFYKIGDVQLAEYIYALLSEAHVFVPQIYHYEFQFLKRVTLPKNEKEPLPLPDVITEDVRGIVNATRHGVGVNKFLLQGAPGTGKTETAKAIAKLLKRDLFIVNFASLIDSKLGQTGKNITQLFEEINKGLDPQQTVVLFDEIDALALNRSDSQDLREMGRATTLLLNELENIDNNLLLLATTNLFERFDKALVRRFDAVIDFNRYSRQDLIDIAEIILNNYLPKFKHAGRNNRLFKKIITAMDSIPYPGDLKNLIKSALAFSSVDDKFDYLRILYKKCHPQDGEYDLKALKEQGFSLRDTEVITGISKSQVGRELQNLKIE